MSGIVNSQFAAWLPISNSVLMLRRMAAMSSAAGALTAIVLASVSACWASRWLTTSSVESDERMSGGNVGWADSDTDELGSGEASLPGVLAGPANTWLAMKPTAMTATRIDAIASGETIADSLPGFTSTRSWVARLHAAHGRGRRFARGRRRRRRDRDPGRTALER